MKKRILIWEIGGVLFLIFFGSFVHFTYELSNYNPVVALFSAVNESVWEHLKLGFWSMVVFMFIEYYFLKKEVNNFFFSKAVGILSMEIFIPLFFYSYTFITNESIFVLDIFSYIVSSIIAQAISYKFLTSGKLDKRFEIIGILFFVLGAINFWIFTYYPPKLGIFREESSGRYGTEWNYKREGESHEH